MKETANELIQVLQSDGLVMLRKVFDPAEVKLAYQECEKWLEIDLAERKQKLHTAINFEGSVGKSQLNPGKHILLDFYAKSATLDRLVNRFLTDPRIQTTLETMVGKNYKLRGYNIRQMTGELDLSAMEWHRDNRGEFTLAFMLTESFPEGDGTTCYIPGSHRYPLCPNTEALIPSPHACFNPKIGVFSRMLARKLVKKSKSAAGKEGDVYLFLGDLWHGRQPNVNGRKGTVLFIGLFPQEIPFPHPVEIPKDEVLDQLPAALRKIVNYDKLPKATEPPAFVSQLEASRKSARRFTLWNFAKLERKAADSISQRFKNRRSAKQWMWLAWISIKPLVRGNRGSLKK